MISVERQGSVLVAALRGEIDLSNAATVSQQVLQAVPDDATTVVLDLSRVTYLDSTGVRLLFELEQSLGRDRRRLVAVAPEGGPVRAVLDIAAVSSRVPVRGSLEEAQAVFRPE